ncbi:MAG: ribonuclease III domain-containing protein [Corallococcus sp.]|nr:ribonuclease III domain-containing protein [Corallococcus sp.]MCM1359054.1 ribonuclease III domain-containing protein [Corallococcus sp.]
MFLRNGVDLNWSTFFNVTKEEKEEFLKQIRVTNVENFKLEQYKFLFTFERHSMLDENFDVAFKIEILNFCIEEANFAADILSEENYLKCLELFKRKQYDSKLLKTLLGTFICFLSQQEQKSAGKKLSLYLERDIKKRVNELQEQKAEKAFMPLKKQIDNIAAGVKGYCYLAAENPNDYGVRINLDFQIKTELNVYLKEKYSYDFNALNGNWNLGLLVLSGNHIDDINHVFQKALYNDNEFWEKHKKFNIVVFLEVVYQVNDSRHAEKILDYIFTEITKIQYGKEILDKSLPLVFLKKEDFLYGLEERTFRFTFDRFKNYYDLRVLSKNNLCFPFVNVSEADKKIRQGKQIVEEFLHEIYPDEFECVLEILKSEINAPSTAFSARKQALCNVNGQMIVSSKDFDEWNIQHIFDYPTFGYHNHIVDREAVKVYCPEYFSAENIWYRFYLKAFYMFKLVDDKRQCFANLFEVYYDLFQFIEEKAGIKTSYQRNTESRNEAFTKLAKILNRYGITISDEYKSDYIISLLDRKVAIREESERFPVLEQLGDAVYGLAVAEMLFYNPYEKDSAEDYNDYITAKRQVKVAEKIGVDKLYLSSYSLPRKYESDILINPTNESYALEQEREQFNNDKKYIADSLEMIIGTVCKDLGYKTAIDFTKQIIKETYPDKFSKEFRWEDKSNEIIDKDYWTRILPAPYTLFDETHRVLWQAFDKLFKAYVLGTEAVETRRFITNSFSDNKLYDNIGTSYEVNQVFYEYLHKGLECVIEKFSNSVKEKYKELKK